MRRQVRHHLMTEEVEVDPLRGTATFGTPQQPAIEAARDLQVMHREGEVEGAGGVGGSGSGVQWSLLAGLPYEGLWRLAWA
jgi:hypothetical protein